MIAAYPFTSSHRMTIAAVRRGLIDWISASECDWALTLNPNRSLQLASELRVLRMAFTDADRALLGERFNKVDGRKRLLVFVMPERVKSNLHFHLALRPGFLADECEGERRARALIQAWQERVPSATSDLEPIKNLDGWSRYITKEMCRGEAEFVPTNLWWPERQRKHVLESSWRDPLNPSAAI